jgi:pimeloyl-ACP methyl ester carboxylesterase
MVGVAFAGEVLPRRNAASAEPLAGIETSFGDLETAEGYRLRTIVTRPNGSRQRIAAVYFVQWLSCDTVEIGRTEDGWTQMLRSLVSDSGMVVMRLEKAGVGDSEGEPCSALDYESELAHHRLAVERLRRHRWVDPRRVFVFGASMGANMAPLVAQGQRVRGIAVWGGGAQSWFERQLGFERRALELSGASGAEIDQRMRALARVYSALLLERMDLAQMEAAAPELATAWREWATGTEGATQFGRPMVFHQQAQARHWGSAWETVDVPVLALFGEHDWYEDPVGVELIGAIVNRRSRGRAEVHIVPGIDHHFARYPTRSAAFTGAGGTPDAAAVMSILLPWLRQRAA